MLEKSKKHATTTTQNGHAVKKHFCIIRDTAIIDYKMLMQYWLIRRRE
jgi:hypothetical protein